MRVCVCVCHPQVRAGLGPLDEYFVKLADGMIAWIEGWRQLNPAAAK